MVSRTNGPSDDGPEALPGLVHTRVERECAVSGWLLAAARDVRVARLEWGTYGAAVLRCGAVFTTVAVPAALVHAAAGADSPKEVAAYLAAAVGGPVYYEEGAGRYNALVSATAAAHWAHPDATCACPGALALVPTVECTEPGEGPAYWVVPVDGPDDLCDTEDVAEVVACGRARLNLEEADGDE